MALHFYNRHGEAIAYTDDGTHIYSWGGKPLAYIADDKIYSFAGQFRGWFNDGWIRDAAGNTMLFTRDARGGRLKPLLQLTRSIGQAARSNTSVDCQRWLTDARPVCRAARGYVVSRRFRASDSISVFGWKAEKMALAYTRKADRKRLAQSAAHRTE
jgi:hypothetical protein